MLSEGNDTNIQILFLFRSSLLYNPSNHHKTKLWPCFVPFHKGNGTGGTPGTKCPNNADVFVPSVPLVPLIPRNGTEQDGDSG